MEAFLRKKPHDVDIICRVCLANNVELFHIFDDTYKIEEHTYSQVLSELTIYKIYRHDQLPHQICAKCMESAREAYLFKRQVEKSFRTLLDVVFEAANFRRIKQSQERSGVDQGVQTTEIAMHVCKLCNMKFFEKPKLREHFLNTHGGDYADSQCSMCDKKFENFQQLYTHMSRDHSEAIECPICNKSFGRRHHMYRHLQNVHKQKESLTLETPEIDEKYSNLANKFECPICKKCFGRRQHMHRHLQNVHKRNPKESSIWDEYEINNFDNNHVKEDSKHVKNELKKSLKLEPKPEIDGTYSNLTKENFIDANQHDDNSSDVEFSDIDDMKSDVNLLESSDDEQTNDNPLQLPKEFTISPTLPPSDHNKHINDDNALEDEVDDSDYVMANNSADEQPICTMNEIDLKLKDELENNCSTTDKEEISSVKAKRRSKDPMINDELLDNRCKVCERTFSRRCHLLRHMRTHLDQKPHACMHCSKHFGRTDNLKKHILSVHGDKEFKCTKCDWACASSDALERHNAFRHGDGEPNAHKMYACEFCDKRVVSNKSLRKHISLMHTNRVYECKNCKLQFKDRTEFRKHEKTHVQNYLCWFCGESFVRKDYLTVHMRRHTGEKPYKCKYCEKAFPRATDLNIHERYHIGHKPNMCTLCGKEFHRAYNLTIHMRTHNGEKPYKCDQCPKSFAQRNDLKTHIRLHTGERYKCENCDAAFLRLYVLRQHAMAAHGVCIESSTGRLKTCAVPTVVQPQPIQPGPYASLLAPYLQQTPQSYSTTSIVSNETIIPSLKTEI